MPISHKTRVLVVDDAVVVRKMLSDALARDPDFEVAGTAVNGRVALAKYPALKPDIVVLDIEMPEMDGLETVRCLRKIDARVPIIMFSTLTERGASATLDALALGATDYVTKPSNSGMEVMTEIVVRELIPRMRALCRLPDISAQFVKPAGLPAIPFAAKPRPFGPVQVVAIGVSTGGPDALAHLLPSLPANFPVPLVIAQHMPPIFTSMLAARLASKSALPVRECVSGELLQPGCAVLAPGDFHMVVSKQEGSILLKTHQSMKENFCRPSVDVLLRSIATVFGARSLAVVLTGMGQDGLKGCEMLRTAGARIYVQDEASSVVWGMPGSVAKAGLADKVLPLDQIAAEIVRATTLQTAARPQLLPYSDLQPDRPCRN